MKPKVYIETSVVSYLTARLSNNLIVAGHQQITQEWWEKVLPQVECIISLFVIEEVSRGDVSAASKRLEAIKDFSVLSLNDDVKELANKYLKGIELPDKAKIDAFHLAFAAWYKVDYLVSWNCTHIASARVRKLLEKLNNQLNIQTPIICTPEELMEV
jgi:hypothetical protein